MPFAFEKLHVYEKSITFADAICTLTKTFPRGYFFLAWEGFCQRAACHLRSGCTQSKTGRTIKRHYEQARIDHAREQSQSLAARRDRRRRKYLIEGSFARGANDHHLKRSRWRRLWRQQIQDWLIASVQNIKILINAIKKKPKKATAMAMGLLGDRWAATNNPFAPKYTVMAYLCT